MREFKLTALMAATSFMLCSGLMTNNTQMYWMASVLGFLMLSTYLILRFGIRRLSVDYQCPTELTEGETVSVPIEVRTPSVALVLITEAKLQMSNAFAQGRIEYPPPTGTAFALLGRAAPSLHEETSPPVRSQKIRVELDALRRGLHTLGPLEIAITDPFGLFTQRQTIPLTKEVLILPRAVPLPIWHWEAGGHGRHLFSSALRGQRGEGTDWHGTRPYIPGDPLRRINWRATARHEEWHVKEFETSQIVPLMVAIEQAPRWRQVEGATPEFDQAVRHIGWLMSEAPRHGVQMSMLQPDLTELMLTVQAYRQLLRYLALLQPTAEQSLLDLIPQIVQRYGQSHRLVLFVPSHEKGYYDSLVRPYLQQGYAIEVVAPLP